MGGAASLILSAVMVMALAHFGILNSKGSTVSAACKCDPNRVCPRGYYCCDGIANCNCINNTACEK
jgi:hypothetical protein